MDIARKAFGWSDWKASKKERGNVAYLTFKIKLIDGSVKTGMIITWSKSQLMPGVVVNNKNQFMMDYTNKFSDLLSVYAGRYYDAERKLLITLLGKIDGFHQNIESMELSFASEKGYCRFCQSIIDKLLNYIAINELWKIMRLQFIFRNDGGDPSGVRKFKIPFQIVY